MNVADRQKPAPGELYLDHVSHFVPDLDAAAGLLERLGFAVTPTSIQMVSGNPAGASNRCVMLDEGYIELLTPTHDTPAANRMRERMKLFVGVHLACFGTPDAGAEHRRLQDHGFEPQPIVDLERKVEEGKTARFKVVRPAPEKMPEGRVQYVQQLTPEHIWREGSVNEFSLKELYVVADDPAETAARWARFAGLLPRAEGELTKLECARGKVFIGNPETLQKLLGNVPPAPALAGYALACRHPKAFAEHCSKSGIRVRESQRGYCAELPEALGGAWLF